MSAQASPSLWGPVARRYYRHFICGFCYYMVLPLLLLLPFGLMSGFLGGKFGTHLLFFHDDPLKQCVSGVALSFLWAEVFFVGYLLCLRDMHKHRLKPWYAPEAADPDAMPPAAEAPPAPADGTRPQPPSFLEYALNISLFLVVTLALIAFAIFLLTRTLDRLDNAAYDWFQGDWRFLLRLNNLSLPAGIALGAALLLGVWYFRVAAGIATALGVAYQWLVSFLFYLLYLIGLDVQQGRQGVRALLRIVWVLTLILAFDPVLSFSLPREWSFPYIPVLFTIAGMALTLVAKDEYLARTGPLADILFVLALLANVVLDLVVFGYLVSHIDWGVLLAVPAVLPLLALQDRYFQLFCPTRWRGFVRLSEDKFADGDPHQINALRDGLGLFAFALVLLSAVILVPTLQPLLSPVPVLVFLLILLTAFYGLFTYAIRRALFWVIGVMIVICLIANLHPYRMRFQHLRGHYSVAGLVHFPRLLDGDDTDLSRQVWFDTLLRSYEAIDRDLDRIARLIDEADQQALELNDPNELDTLSRRRVQLLAGASARRLRRETLRFELLDRWNDMEQKNRVRAGRLLPSFLDQVERRADEAEGRDQDVSLGEFLYRSRDRSLPLIPTSDVRYYPQRAAKDRKGSRDNVLVLVSVSGGGIRAAYWSFAVLKELELAFTAEGIDLPSRVRLICGASGGMLGASYYVTTLPHPDERPVRGPGRDAALERRRGDFDHQMKCLSSDFLTPLTKCLVISDLPGWLSPFPMRYDRGQALESTWVEALTDPRRPGVRPLAQSFAKLKPDEVLGWKPSLAFTPMMIEDSRRLVISNLDLRYAISNDGPVLTRHPTPQGAENLSIDALEFFRLFPQAHASFPVSTAVRMSASFPFFSPAVSLPTAPRRRVVDAGYYDNYGVTLAASWLFSRDNDDWMDQFDRVLLIQIRDGVTEDSRQLRAVDPDASSFFSRSMEEVTSPPEGLYNATFGSSSFRNDGLLELYNRFRALRRARQTLEEDRAAVIKRQPRREWWQEPFLVANIETGEHASLSWYLSEDEKRRIHEDARHMGQPNEIIPKLLKWWKAPTKDEGPDK